MASYKNIVVLAVAAVVVFLVLFAAYRPTASHPVFNSTYYVLNQHIPELLSGARSVGLIFGQNSSGSVVLYFLNPYDGANYTAANINSTVVNMINNGSLQLIVLPNSALYAPTGNSTAINSVDNNFMALDLCLYHVNKSAALNYMLWFENTTATKGPAIGNVTYSQLAQQLSKYGVNASTINITQCKNELATMTTNSSQLESKALTWAGDNLVEIPPTPVVLVAINVQRSLAVLNEYTVGYLPPLLTTLHNLATQTPLYYSSG
ncbi:hypothetical protein GCM10007981_14840 [Thermocladium modestius]|uniref:Uncharacterized protein n=1 Tax=Thermocladium modestius TaxID=62609 RepID=A0A830GWG3_9CREN|nr:hypothetical protein [Thermocladium modestius]GGP21753.1 hypothetical protein GCM10007981_14840 [Thermocladium modestius]